MRTKFYLDKRGKPILVQDNITYPIKIAINSNGSSSYIATDIEVKEDQWESKPGPGRIVNHPRADYYNLKLAEKKLQIDKIADSLREAGKLHGKSAAEIKTAIVKELDRIIYGDGIDYSVLKCFDLYISTKTRKGTILVLEGTKRKLLSYKEFNEKTTFKDISVSWLIGFDSFLARTSPSANARGVHLRNIRTVFNYALAEEFTKAPYPFRRFKIKVDPTPDRSLSIDELTALASYKGYKSHEKYRDIFMLSFFLCGLNLEDMIGLRELKSGRVETRRIKTGQVISIKVQPEAQEIIDRYRGKKYLLDIMDYCANYKNYQRRINKYLKLVGKTYNPKIKEWEGNAIVDDISFYCARYSWATLAAELDVPERTIGAALSHSASKSVTSIYTRVDMRKKIDAANRKVLDFFLENLKLKKV